MGPKVTIHQPEHMPWLGFFHKMGQADLYVLLDRVQFTKNNWQNRNKFVDRAGNDYWLSVPVVMKGHTDKTIAEMEIDYRQPWVRKYWGRLKDSYCRHPFFPQYETRLEKTISAEHKLLVDLNVEIIELIREGFGITTPMMRSSAMPVSGTKSDLLLAICTHVGADCYLSGPSGKNYLEQSKFSDQNVKLEFHEFKQPVYSAPYYKPYLAALDLLLNHGPEARSILFGSAEKRDG